MGGLPSHRVFAGDAHIRKAAKASDVVVDREPPERRLFDHPPGCRLNDIAAYAAAPIISHSRLSS